MMLSSTCLAGHRQGCPAPRQTLRGRGSLPSGGRLYSKNGHHTLLPAPTSLSNGKHTNGKVDLSSGAGPRLLSRTPIEEQRSSNGSKREGNAPVAGAPTTPSLAKETAMQQSTPKVDHDVLSSCDAGQLELCAVETLSSMDPKALADPTIIDSSTAARPQATTGAPASEPAANPYSSPGGKWSRLQSYSTIQRTWDIWSFAISFAVRLWWSGKKLAYRRTGMTPEAVSAKKTELACWVREGLVRLGPTFIKIGQQFSTRGDVLSREFVQELEKLQDNVPAFDSATAVAMLEEELGRPVGAAYASFSRTPLAAASLGQVHYATLAGGEPVVVKIQRPGLKRLFDIDLKNIRVLAQWLQRLDPKTDGAARDWVAIYDECSRILYEEIDYTKEGASADLFRANFAGVDWVKVPRIKWDLTTERVLTMEYAPGVKINNTVELDRLGLDRQLLATRAVEAYLQQILRHGFFHADPHPGNIAVDGQGRLIYYDFGMMGSIPGDVRGGLLELFYGVYEKDADRCLTALTAMGVLVPTGDMTAVRRTADFFLRSFSDRLTNQKEPQRRTKEEKRMKRKEILSSIGEDLLLAAADKPFRFPATFTFVVRSFTVLDGIGKTLAPGFDISKIAAPYARDLLLEGRPLLAKASQDFRGRLALQNRAVVNLFRAPNLVQDSADLLQRLERGELKLRVRALEAERALDRVARMQTATLYALLASALVQVGSAATRQLLAQAAFGGAGVAGMFAILSLAKVRSLQKKESLYTGSG
ncbi:AKC4 [Auxenochlorella protothecoides x Auxenochlorella symbiontica]